MGRPKKIIESESFEKETELREETTEKVGVLQVPEEQIASELTATRKVRDEKRNHLVFHKGREVWWTPMVIETVLKTRPKDIEFPIGSEYVIPANLKTCITCG